MGVYSKFKSAKASGGGRNYLQEGRHRLMITEAKIDHSRQKLEFFAVSASVVETDSDDRSMQPGQMVDWMTMSDKDAYAGNVKQFFGAAFNLTEAAIDELTEDEFEEMMELLVGPSQGCVGRFIDVSVKETTTKTGGKFNACRWLPAPDEMQPGAEEA